MVPEVEDSVAIGLRVNGDVEVVLFVTLVPTAEGGGGGKGGRGGGVSLVCASASRPFAE